MVVDAVPSSEEGCTQDPVVTPCPLLQTKGTFSTQGDLDCVVFWTHLKPVITEQKTERRKLGSVAAFEELAPHDVVLVSR